METRLSNARDFFAHITEPAYMRFKDGEVTFLIAYSMAAGLYHIAEWVWYHDKVKVIAKFGSTITSSSDLWLLIETKITNAGYIRDFNNAAKHVKLTFDPKKKTKRNPSTGMHYAANTMLTTSAYGEGGFGRGAFGGGPVLTFHDGGQTIFLELVATELFLFWKRLIENFYPIAAV